MTIKELKTLTYGSVFRFPKSDYNYVILGINKAANAISYVRIDKTIKITDQILIEALQKRDISACNILDLTYYLDCKIINYEPFTFVITKLHLMQWKYYDYEIFNVKRPLVEEFGFCTELSDLKPLHMYFDLNDRTKRYFYVYDGKASVSNKLIDLTKETFLLRDDGLISPVVYNCKIDVGSYVTINSFPFLILDKKHLNYTVVPCKPRIENITDFFGETRIVKKSSFDKINYIMSGYDKVTMKLVKKYEKELRELIL